MFQYLSIGIFFCDRLKTCHFNQDNWSQLKKKRVLLPLCGVTPYLYGSVCGNDAHCWLSKLKVVGTGHSQ